MRPSEWGRVGHIFNLCNADLLTETILLQAKSLRGTRNPNLQVVIMHASHVCSQHLFGLRMNGIQRTQFDHSHLDLLSLGIWSRLFGPSITWNLRKAQCWSWSVFILHRFPALRNLWLFLVFNNVLISLTLYFCLYIKDKSAELRKKKGEKNEKVCDTKLYQLRQWVLCSKDSSEKLGCPFDSV